jgi:hypothetical protein
MEGHGGVVSLPDGEEEMRDMGWRKWQVTFFLELVLFLYAVPLSRFVSRGEEDVNNMPF